jgi:hypothetical protein
MKNLLFLLVLLIVLPAQAQLTVDENGYTLIGDVSEEAKSPLSVNYEGNADAACSVKGDAMGLYSLRTGIAHWGIGIQGVSKNPETGFSVGIKGVANNTNELSSGRSYGVIGLASNATDGWNYGVFGRLEGTSNGAAIYGTVNPKENGEYMDDRYAGYFKGNTKVDGDLSVSGAINGLYLGIAAPSTSSSSVSNIVTVATENNEETLAEKISNLSLNSCYINNDIIQGNTALLTDSIAETAEFSKISIQSQEKKHYLLSADQIEQEFPDLVYELNDGSRAINYIELIPVLVQTINELNNRISLLESNQSSVKKIASSVKETKEEIVAVKQNTPNPFSDTSTILITVPSTIKEAVLCFYDLTGTQKKAINIVERGTFSIILNASEFEGGMYVYSLIADGKLVSSNKMIVLK